MAGLSSTTRSLLDPQARGAELRASLDIIEFALLLLLFAWLLFKGYLAQRDEFYDYLGGFVLFAFVLLRYQERIFTVNRTILLYLIFAAFAAFSMTWAHSVHYAILDVRVLFAALPTLLALYHICRTPAGVRRVLLSLRIVLVASVAFAIAVGAYAPSEREFLQLNSSGIAPFMLLSFVAVFLELHCRPRWRAGLLYFVPIVLPILLVSSVRAVATIIAVLGTYYFFVNMSTMRGRLIGGGFAALVALMLGYFGSSAAGLLQGTRYFRHFSHMEAYLEDGVIEGSVGYRIYVQGLALDMFEDSPIIGHGLNNSRELYDRVLGVPTYSHSGYMELLVGLGLVGLVLFLSIFSEAVRKCSRLWTSNPRSAAAVLSIIIGLLTFNAIGALYKVMELMLLLPIISSQGTIELLRRPD